MNGRVKAVATVGSLAALVVVAVGPAYGDETVPTAGPSVQATAGTASSPEAPAASAPTPAHNAPATPPPTSNDATSTNTADGASSTPTTPGEATQPVSPAEAVAIAQKLNDTKDAWAGPTASNVVGAMPMGDHVVVLVDGSAAAQNAVDHRVPAAVEDNVTVAKGGIALAAANNDPGPIWKGGTWITNGLVNCTAGFVWVKNGVRLLSTAAHCGGGTWKSAAGGSIGTVLYKGTGANDVELIQSPGKTLVSSVYTPTMRAVSGVCTNAVDQTVSYYGRTSGGGGGVIIGANWSATGLYLTTAKTVRPGDSGGPVFTVDSNGSACARGTVRALTYQDTNGNGKYDSTDIVTGMIFVDAAFTERNLGTTMLTGAAGFTYVAPATISGTVRVGSTLRATTGAWTPAPEAFAYQWKRNGVAIAGATGATYSPGWADSGNKLSVTITATRPGYIRTDSISVAKTVAPGVFTTVATPTLSGAMKVGATLTANPGTWTPAANSIKYQWYRNWVAIPGATRSTYTPTASDYGTRIFVRVIGTRAGYEVRTPASNNYAIALGTWKYSYMPKIVGTPRVGSQVLAYAWAWTPTPTSVRYQWYRNGVAIPGATAKTYVLKAADRGKKIIVSMTGSRPGYVTVKRVATAITPW